MKRPSHRGPRLVAWAALFLLAGQPLSAAAPYQLRVDKQGWGDAAHADIAKVLRSSCDAIARHLGDAKLEEPIRVRRSREGPITLFRRNLRKEIVVELSAGDRFWCQYAYQMAHEFAHILAGFREGGRENLWFEEALCELASMFSLRSMAQSWQTKPPYPNWKGYSSAIAEYSRDLERKFGLPRGLTLAEYYREHADHLRTNPTDRGKNGTVALALLPLLEENPEAWQALRHLNDGRGKHNLPFAEHLRNWRDHCPERHRGFVDDVADALGLSL